MSNIDEINSIVRQSGNSFHCRVVNYLKAKGWHILISPYYMDGGTGKPREIDLIAEKAWPYEDRFDKKYRTINVKLFIECKYIPQNIVFWFCDKDLASAKEWVTMNTPLRADNSFIERHHYLSTNAKVAKLFASKNKPNVENEVIYKALNQSLNAMVYLRGRESIIPRNPRHRQNVLASIEIPIIICNSFDKFYRVEMSEITEPVKIDGNFQLEVNYAYIDIGGSHRSEYFLLDILDFTKLDSFLSIIEADVDAIYHLV